MEGKYSTATHQTEDVHKSEAPDVTVIDLSASGPGLSEIHRGTV